MTGRSKDEVFYKAWYSARNKCMVCGITHGGASQYRWPGLETHHIIKPGRSHEATNLIRVCRRCHQLAEGSEIVGNINGVKYRWPRLTIENVIWCRMVAEHEGVDLMRLSVLLGRYVPKPVGFVHPCWIEWRTRKYLPVTYHMAWNLVDVPHDKVARPVDFLGVDMQQFMV